MRLTRASYIGNKIKKLRKQKGWTQLELATAAGLSSTYIGFLETGLRRPSLRSLERIARALKVKSRDIL